MQASDGLLYGTTNVGGAYGKGTAFQFNPLTGALKTLVAFKGTNGASPQGGLMQAADGRLYGATTSGGAIGNGVIYRISLF
jgi:uncharacterized repeat protein (TIGR03803 family)